jgi:hypothetical protein
MKDAIAVIERTGQYHVPVRCAFQAAGLEVRMVHPYATKQYRQPADPGNKTDALPDPLCPPKRHHETQKGS